MSAVWNCPIITVTGSKPRNEQNKVHVGENEMASLEEERHEKQPENYSVGENEINFKFHEKERVMYCDFLKTRA